MSEPFPSIDEDVIDTNAASATADPAETPLAQERRKEAHSDASTISGRLRSASKRFNESSPPVGFSHAVGEVASSTPSIADFRRGAFKSEGWSPEGQIIERERRASLAQSGSDQSISLPGSSKPRVATNARQDSLPEYIHENEVIHSATLEGPGEEAGHEDSKGRTSSKEPQKLATLTEPFPNGYEFPPKHTWKESTVTFLKASWKFGTTPLGFLIIIYGLNVVAWGGMLFLLLCNASPAMCHLKDSPPDCNNINSPRRIWIEIDSQILNALFCVTGFGLIPWRFRDFYHLLNYRMRKTEEGLTRLAGIHRDWFRLEGSQDLPVNIGPSNIEEVKSNVPLSSIPYPPKSIPEAPLTGIRAPPTPSWKLDFVVWAFVLNTCLQVVLSVFMWAYNREKRPSWSTGLFVALACIIAIAGGLMIFIEGKRVKGIEGVPVSESDLERLKMDREMGIVHYNNISDAAPKEKKTKAKAKKESEYDGVEGPGAEIAHVENSVPLQ